MSIVVKLVTDVLTVPSPALHTEDGETYVHVVDGEERRRTAVKTGRTYGIARRCLRSGRGRPGGDSGVHAGAGRRDRETTDRGSCPAGSPHRGGGQVDVFPGGGGQ